MELQTAGFKAEYGRPPRYRNLVTKSETNEFHGGVRVVSADGLERAAQAGVCAVHRVPCIRMDERSHRQDKLYYLWSGNAVTAIGISRAPYDALPDTSTIKLYLTPR